MKLAIIAGIVIPALLAGGVVVGVNGTAVGAAGDPIVAIAGDIACDPAVSAFYSGAGTATKCRQKATSDLVHGKGYTAVLVAGDIQYECGGYDAFLNSFDQSWGRFKSTIRPVPGNHEYKTSGGTDCDSTGKAADYFRYFGSAAGSASKGYYSFDLGQWHIVALNSNCSRVGGCGAGSPQEQWLKDDLAATTERCILAYWHHPRFSSGYHGNSTSVAAFWSALYEKGADVVVNGHDHNYERFNLQTPSGTASSAGIREFVVGTGGKSLRPFSTTRANSAVRNSSTYGILQVTLRPTSYEWKFVPEAGKTFTDSGSTSCH